MRPNNALRRVVSQTSPIVPKKKPPPHLVRYQVFPHARSSNEIEAWQNRFRQVKAGSQKSVLSVLEERGYVKDIAGTGGRETLDWLLTEKPVGAYVGVDPTAPSLHVGHLLPLMALFWMYLLGHNTVSLVGGGTVKIGDPSGRSTARTAQTKNAIAAYTECMDKQLYGLWANVKALGVKHGFTTDVGLRRYVANNDNWLGNWKAVDMMRQLGSGMRLLEMMSRDTVKMRVESGTGMSFAEFSYPLFQGYDFFKLYERSGVQMQIGGSDQFGNIVAGMDAVKYMRDPRDAEDKTLSLFGLTTPLLTTSSGEKFGKSAGNAVWLDSEMLNSFDLYQYFLCTADDDVERYLKLFTFLPLQHIEVLMNHQKLYPEKRSAQRVLAREVVELAHGAKAAMRAEMAHEEAFSHGTKSFPLSALRSVLASHARSGEDGTHRPTKAAERQKYLRKFKEPFMNTTPSTPTSRSFAFAATASASQDMTPIPSKLVHFPDANFYSLLVAAGLTHSNTEARYYIKTGGAYVAAPPKEEGSNELIWTQILQRHKPSDFVVENSAILLRVGKTKIKLCKLVEEKEVEGGESGAKDNVAAMVERVDDPVNINESIPETGDGVVAKDADEAVEVDESVMQAVDEIVEERTDDRAGNTAAKDSQEK